MDVLSMGVEEEYLLADRTSRAVVNRAPQVIRTADATLGEQVQAEFYNTQVEVNTEPTTSCDDLRHQLTRLRGSMAEVAREADCLLVASGAPVIGPQEPLTVTDTARYRLMAGRFAALVGPYGIACGCHVHLGTLDRRRALLLTRYIRPWLPVIQAMTVNSPFACGRDTGWDSWRFPAFSRWPTVGPPLVLDEQQYLCYVDGLVNDGVLLDRRMLYWHARPSEHVPTVEIRIADVNADLDTVVLTAALARGLATSLLADADAQIPPSEADEARLHRAHRMAAAHGLNGPGLDPLTGCEQPAVLLVEQLIDRAAPGLTAAGDLESAHVLWDRLRRGGTGAVRQRAIFESAGSLPAVVDGLAEATAAAVSCAGSAG